MEVRYAIATYATPAEAEAARAALARVGIEADLLPPAPHWTARVARALRGRTSEVRLGVWPRDVTRARRALGLSSSPISGR
jgi:cell division protein FtsN